MNILHYSLGFPPFRRGGMIKYCMDLIEEQTKAGHNVSLIWPGEIYSFGEKSRIIMRKKYSFSKQTVCLNFELINPLPVRNYYINILKMCDKLHFNSNLSMETYGEFFDLKDSGEVIGITHSSIINKKHIKNKHDVLNFAYLGPCTDSRKGFFVLKQAMDELYKTYNNEFRLHVFSPISGETPCYLVQHNPYKYEELDYIMENIDMVIVPSVWHETFGFTVLEALSYGVPVLVSENVGAKDLIVQEKNGLVTKLEKHELEASIEKILQNPQILVKMNKYIVKTKI